MGKIEFLLGEIKELSNVTDSYSDTRDAFGGCMYQVKQLAALTLLMISLEGAALAKGGHEDINSKAFVLRGPTRPTPVVSLKEATKQKNEFMRMPDLGGDESISPKDITAEARQNGLSGHEGQERLEDQSDHKTRGSHESGHLAGVRSARGSSKSTLRELPPSPTGKESLKSLRFDAVKISGTLRLPRVKFARVGMAMDLRDEMPSLDFTQKSLKDSGF